MIETRMVRNEVDDELHAARVQLQADGGKIVPGTDPRIGLIARNAERRAGDVVDCPVREGGVERVEERRIVQRDLSSERASLPDPHEIDEVDAAIA